MPLANLAQRVVFFDRLSPFFFEALSQSQAPEDPIFSSLGVVESNRLLLLFDSGLAALSGLEEVSGRLSPLGFGYEITA